MSIKYQSQNAMKHIQYIFTNGPQAYELNTLWHV